MHNSDSRLDSEALERKLREQIRAQGGLVGDEVRQILRDAEEISEREKIARELVQKFLQDPPIRGSVGFDFF